MTLLDDYLPTRINQGPWVTAYTLNHLQGLQDAEFILPVCSLGTPFSECASLGRYVLPPLYSEAMDATLKNRLIERIFQCFPKHGDAGNVRRLRVIESPAPASLPTADATDKLLAFSVDTAVEEHGPHLPLGTDTLQSYSVLRQLTSEFPQLQLERPLDYGQLTWGLPFGYSVDLTAELLSQYVTGYFNALVRWKQPAAVYVVDVHGSITHRSAIVDGLQASSFANWTFRWLHEPLASFASARGDQHAGGVETTLVERIDESLIDHDWWPSRIDALATSQMSFDTAVELTGDLDAFTEYVRLHQMNGIIGDVRNYHDLDANDLFERMMVQAREDVRDLLAGTVRQNSGEQFWK